MTGKRLIKSGERGGERDRYDAFICPRPRPEIQKGVSTSKPRAASLEVTVVTWPCDKVTCEYWISICLPMSSIWPILHWLGLEINILLLCLPCRCAYELNCFNFTGNCLRLKWFGLGFILCVNFRAPQPSNTDSLSLFRYNTGQHYLLHHYWNLSQHYLLHLLLPSTNNHQHHVSLPSLHLHTLFLTLHPSIVLWQNGWGCFKSGSSETTQRHELALCHVDSLPASKGRRPDQWGRSSST